MDTASTTIMNEENKTAAGAYRSPSDVASPVTQKISAIKNRRISKNAMKQRSLFASTVSSQHLKQSVHGSNASDYGNSLSDSNTNAGEISAGSQSEGSMADDELDVFSDKSDETVVLKTSRSKPASEVSDHERPLPAPVDKTLDDGYLADESERN